MVELKIDGRRTVKSPIILQAFPIREGTRRLIVDGFLKEGRSTHSRIHATLAYTIDYCEKNHIPYKLTAIPGRGYLIERINK